MLSLWVLKEVTRPLYPFTAILGQDEMKLALILNIIDPQIGGVMVMGDRGTGKSTTVRALTPLLPRIAVLFTDAFNSCIWDVDLMSESRKNDIQYKKNIYLRMKAVPIMDLPVGASEDRVCGTIDVEKALTNGSKAFEPGILAKANKGILYVDEINLLDDYLVDILLDSAASGWNTVERDGISIKHPAKFVLVGSANPEEGQLRPQLLDRFGLNTEIFTPNDPLERLLIVTLRLHFDKYPNKFISHFGDLKIPLLRKRISLAKEKLSESDLVFAEVSLARLVAETCSTLDIDGLRGDIVIARAATAYAAWNFNNRVFTTDIEMVITPCLRHRIRDDYLDYQPTGSPTRGNHVALRVFAFLYDSCTADM